MTHIKGFECVACQQYFCKKCRDEKKHPHELTKVIDLTRAVDKRQDW